MADERGEVVTLAASLTIFIDRYEETTFPGGECLGDEDGADALSTNRRLRITRRWAASADAIDDDGARARTESSGLDIAAAS